MNILYHKNNGIISLSPLQVRLGQTDGLTPLTPEELEKLKQKPEDITIDNTQSQIDECKKELSETDYKTLKQIEQNCYTEEEYQTIKDRREFLRSEIRRLEEE